MLPIYCSLRRLLRIADGDYSADEYAERFPKFNGPDADVTPQQLFEVWVVERRPARGRSRVGVMSSPR